MLKDLMASEAMAPEKCAGCGSPIRDRYYLLVADRAWHNQCLRCCKCLHNLEAELSCYSREGNIYCKDDYYRQVLTAASVPTSFYTPTYLLLLRGFNHRPSNSSNSSSRQRHNSKHSIRVLRRCVSIDLRMIITLTFNARHLLHKDLSVNSLDLSTYDGSQSPGSGGTLTPNCRTKRMRTSFKHHQLRTMKSYFAINQNPDAKDLKQLAQKTGLSKRVLQVWFQNARAKWRRNVMRQDGVMGNPGQTLTGLPSIATATLHHHTGGNPNDGVHDLSSTQVLEEMHNMTFAELY
ncbi:LIM/homeobox protein Lhx2-like [Anopheles darlingi]|uniref:LIM/homeobox protein Lhx2-like n=1 Tax=Anopheles darlingi TaxID=43151 RepID=UPI0021004FE2|nr:LIM/homeobox protein Lhx2-like [Anopheles darlingi]